MTQIISTNTYGGASVLVSPLPYVGNYNTLSDALSQATANVPIFVAPGTYTQNSSLVDNVNIIGYSSAVDDVTITGSLTNPTGQLVCIFSGVSFDSTGSGPSISITGSSLHKLTFNNCNFNAAAHPSLKIVLGSSSFSTEITFNSCSFTTSTNNHQIFDITGVGNPSITFNACTIISTNNITNNFDIGNVIFRNSQIVMNASFSGTNGPEVYRCNVSTAGSPWLINSTFGAVYYYSLVPDSTVSTKLKLNDCTVSTTTVLNGAGDIAFDVLSQIDSATPYYPSSTVVSWNPVTLGFTRAHTLTIDSPLGLASGGTGLNLVSPSNGSLLIGNGTGFSANTLTAGPGISIGNTSGNITISNSSISILYSEESTSFTAVSNSGYYCTGPLTVTLPATPSNSDTVAVIAFTQNNVLIQANTGQYLSFENYRSIVGGTALNSLSGNSVFLRYRSSTTTWIAENFTGSWLVT